jgi:hypothetical protein
MADPFHNTKAWRELAKRFKHPRCVDCDGKEDLQAGHILPASRFKMARLWKSNLVNQCGPCNAKLGNKIRWSLRAVKLLSIYAMIKFLTYLITILIIASLARYAYLDITYNSSTITDQIESDIIEIYRTLNRDV